MSIQNLTQTYLYTGWIVFCPVLISNVNDISPVVEARYPWLEWLFDAAQAVESLSIFVISSFSPEWEPQYMLHHVKELKKPIVRVHG